jgi:hypothetical protein
MLFRGKECESQAFVSLRCAKKAGLFYGQAEQREKGRKW